MIDIKIDFPALTIDYAGDTMRFNMYYREKAQNNYRYASTSLYHTAIKQYETAKSQNFPFNNFEFVEVFEPTYCKKPFISLFYDIYEYTGGAHGNTTRKGNTWDMRRGMIRMDDLFDKKYDYNSAILQYVESDARRRQISGMSHYFEGLSENLKKYYDEKNFYLTEEGLAVFYPLYTIAPYSEGIQVFIVPYQYFGDNLKYQL
jgi:hypothetical protein